MNEIGKELWLDLITKYKESKLLWDPKHKDYTNKRLRQEAQEELFELYKKIDSEASMIIMKKKIDNMRTTYHRERKKHERSLLNGEEYVPTLWYYYLFSFLEEKVDTPSRERRAQTKLVHKFSFNRSNNKIYLEKNSRSKNLKRKIEDKSNSIKNERVEGYINIEPMQSSEEENTEIIQPEPPKRRIYDLLHKQENFVNTASKILPKKEEDWEVIGKSIGLQLSYLEDTQRVIAHKLISDTIFYGCMGKLSLSAFLHVENYEQDSPESNEQQILYVAPESPS